MAFNPDEYLAAKAAPAAFDPDAYLAAQKQADPSLLDSAKHAASVTGRDILSGVAALPLAAADLATGVVNVGRRIAGAEPWPSASQNFQAGLDAAGLDRPQNNTEQLVSAATRGAVGAGSFAGTAGELASTVPGALGRTAEPLARNAGLQSVSGGSAGASGELARQKGAGPIGQTVAAVAGGLAPSVISGAYQVATAPKIASGSIADDTANAARESGYTIPPTQSNPSLTNKTLEGFAGKISTAQKSAVKNQTVTNRLAGESLGLPPDTPITKDALSAVRDEAGQVYQQVKNVGPIAADQDYLAAMDKIKQAATNKVFESLDRKEVQALADDFYKPNFTSADAVEAIKQLRFDGNKNIGSMEPAKSALGKAQLKISSNLEDLIDRNLQSTQPDLVDAYRAARTQIAKSYTIENALNPSTGNVVASKLGAAFKKGKPLSGGLEKIGQFASAYPKAAQEINSSIPGSSPLDWAAAATRSAITQNPLVLLSIGARPAVRNLILSKLYQDSLGAPTGIIRAPINLESIVPGAAPIVAPLERLQAR